MCKVFHVLLTFLPCIILSLNLPELKKKNLFTRLVFLSADIVFTRSWSAAWLDPGNWKREGRRTGQPVPHLERIPCTHDRVVFPEGSSFRVRLPDVAVTVGKISLLGQVLPHLDHSV